MVRGMKNMVVGMNRNGVEVVVGRSVLIYSVTVVLVWR